MIAVLLVACSGGPAAEAPVAAPPVAPLEVPGSAPVVVADVPPVGAPPAPAKPPADAAALLAGIPADHLGKHTPIMNEMSGQAAGESVDLTADTVVFGVPCAGGEGALQVGEGFWGCVLSREATIGPWTLRADTFVGPWYGSWQLSAVVLENVVPPPENIVVGGLTCHTYVHYRADGTLEACALAVETSGLPAGTDVEVAPDGAVTRMIGD